MNDEQEQCFRCKSKLEISEEYDEIVFYLCKPCNRYYAKSEDGSLVDRWLSPLSLALYGIIFEKEWISDETLQRQCHHLLKMDSNRIELILNDIDEELRSPKQLVSKMLDLHCTEEQARDYLKRLAVAIRTQQ